MPRFGAVALQEATFQGLVGLAREHLRHRWPKVDLVVKPDRVVPPSTWVLCVAQQEYQSPVLVEEFIDGREFYIGVIGNSKVEALPIIELDFSQFPALHFAAFSLFDEDKDKPFLVFESSVDGGQKGSESANAQYDESDQKEGFRVGRRYPIKHAGQASRERSRHELRLGRDALPGMHAQKRRPRRPHRRIQTIRRRGYRIDRDRPDGEDHEGHVQPDHEPVGESPFAKLRRLKDILPS